MLLYHFNFGFPLLTEATQVAFPSRTVEPRLPEHPMEGYDSGTPPTPPIRERVYLHKEIVSDQENWASATIYNPDFPLARRAKSYHRSPQLGHNHPAQLGTVAHGGSGFACLGHRTRQLPRQWSRNPRVIAIHLSCLSQGQGILVV